MTIASLFISFFLVGIGAYGGGLVTISLIYHEVVALHSWLIPEEMNQVVTIAQMTPGPIAINMATFTGYRISGIPGSIVATIAVTLPSIIILGALQLFLKSAWAKRVIFTRIDAEKLRRAVRPGIFALFLYAVWTFGKGAITDPILLAIAGASLAFIFLVRSVNPIFVIFLAGIVGMFLYG